MVALADSMRKPFPRYWLSGFLADFGDGVRLAAFPLLAAQLTRSPAAVAGVTAVQGVPWLLLGGGLGVIVDRIDRRRLMVVVDVTRGAMIAALAAVILAHRAGLPLIYATAFVTGTGSALRDTAAATCVPRLVAPDDLERANGRLIAGQVVGSELAGPAVGGWLFGLAAVLPFAVNAGTLGMAVLLLLTLPGVFAPRPRSPTDAPTRSSARDASSGGERTRTWLGSFRDDLAAGLRWTWRQRDIRDMTILVGIACATDAAWFATLVLYVTGVLHQRPGAYGLLLAVGALGGVAAGAAGAALSRRLGPWRSLLAAGLALAVTQAGLGLTSNVAGAATFLFMSSAAFALANITTVTMRQRLIPDALLGRVSSVYGTVARGAEALGALAGGGLAAAAGIRAPMLAGAIPLAAVTAVLAWRHRLGRT